MSLDDTPPHPEPGLTARDVIAELAPVISCLDPECDVEAEIGEILFRLASLGYVRPAHGEIVVPVALLYDAASTIMDGENYKGDYLYEKHRDGELANRLRTAAEGGRGT